MRVTENPPSPMKLNPEVIPLLDAVILKGLARDPGERFQSTDDFIAGLLGGASRGKTLVGKDTPDDIAARIGDETIAVSMSTDAIKHILKSHEAIQEGQEEKKSDSDKPAAAPAAEMDVAATFVGSVASLEGESSSVVTGTQTARKINESLPGSFIVVQGSKRGTKFVLGKELVIIGSDPGCDICISERGVSSFKRVKTILSDR